MTREIYYKRENAEKRIEQLKAENKGSQIKKSSTDANPNLFDVDDEMDEKCPQWNGEVNCFDLYDAEYNRIAEIAYWE